jgi:hypothetical protein
MSDLSLHDSYCCTCVKRVYTHKSYILIFNKGFELTNMIQAHRMRNRMLASENNIFNPSSRIDASGGSDDKDAPGDS